MRLKAKEHRARLRIARDLIARIQSRRKWTAATAREKQLLAGVFRSRILRHAFEHVDYVIRGYSVKNAVRNLISRPYQGPCRIMQHRPIPEHAACHLPADKLVDPDMTVVTANAPIGGSDRFMRALEQLQVYVMPANKCTGDTIALVAASRIIQNAAQYCAVITKGLRRINELG